MRIMKQQAQNDTISKEDRTPQKSKLTDDKLLIEKLKTEIRARDKEIISLQNMLDDSKERIHDVIQEKGSLKDQINQYELKELNLQFGKFEELKNHYNKLEHRLIITKERLDEARKQIQLQNQVILDLEKLSFIDFIRNRYPESYNTYKKQ
jgi:chromosome segregation ATPase